MEGQTGRAEDRAASDTGFRMIFAHLNPAVGTFLAGRSPKKLRLFCCPSQPGAYGVSISTHAKSHKFRSEISATLGRVSIKLFVVEPRYARLNSQPFVLVFRERLRSVRVQFHSSFSRFDEPDRVE